MRNLEIAHNAFSAKKEKCRDLLSEEISCVSIFVSNRLPKRPPSLRVLGGRLLEVQLLYPLKALRESFYLNGPHCRISVTGS